MFDPELPSISFQSPPSLSSLTSTHDDVDDGFHQRKRNAKEGLEGYR
jgi:hypothetical protein